MTYTYSGIAGVGRLWMQLKTRKRRRYSGDILSELSANYKGWHRYVNSRIDETRPYIQVTEWIKEEDGQILMMTMHYSMMHQRKGRKYE